MTRRISAFSITALAAATLLAGCTLERADPTPAIALETTPGAPADQSGTPAPSDGASTPAGVRDGGVPVTSGELTLWVDVAAAAAIELPDGSATFTAPVTDPGALLAAPEGTAFELLRDGSVVLRDGAGAFVGGLAAPTATSADGAALPVRYEDAGAELLRIVGSAYPPADTSGATAGPGTATGWFATTAIDSADWGEREGGRSLAVVPSAWTRAGGAAEQEGAWAALVALEPDADVAGMQDQLRCHALGAPDKATWNLEPWRPAVGFYATLAASCNPT